MKTMKLAIACMLAAAQYIPSSVAAQEQEAIVTIDFGNPSGFTDIEIGGFSGEKEHAIIFDLIRSEFEKSARSYLPNGYTLEIRVQDIDLAGYHEPFYPRYDDIRIMRSVYPPRFKFNYTVLDDDQIIVEQGSPTLTDLNYLWKITLPSQRNDTAFFVRSLVKDWARHDLGSRLK